MTMHFFFLVQNTGSWMEIGNSISHFGIMSAQFVFVPLLFALKHIHEGYLYWFCGAVFSESNLMHVKLGYCAHQFSLKLSFMFAGHLLQLQQQLLIFFLIIGLALLSAIFRARGFSKCSPKVVQIRWKFWHTLKYELIN